MKKTKAILKRVLIAVLAITLIGILVLSGYFLGFSVIIVGAVESCRNEGAERSRLEENRIELTEEYYGVVYGELVSINGALWSHEIPGISSDDIVFLEGMYKGTGRILLNRESEIKVPLLDLENRAFAVDGADAPLGYSELIKRAVNGTRLPDVSGEAVNFRIYLNDNNSFYFKGELIRVEATEEHERRYYCSGYSDGFHSNYKYYLIEDTDGFYAWLDENIFNTEESGGTEGECASVE